MTERLLHRGLSKDDFLVRNRSVIGSYRAASENELRRQYGTGFLPVSWADIWVIVFCEAGIDSHGHVDPTFHHSMGEIGLLPLPSNISFWNGPAAPQSNKKHSLEANVFHYILYLGHLKNRSVKKIADTPLYSGLFESEKSKHESEKNARILAGVVHGYFFAGNYRDNRVPLTLLKDCYEAGRPLPTVMAKTKYKHAGTAIIRNRAQNIEMALRMKNAEL